MSTKRKNKELFDVKFDAPKADTTKQPVEAPIQGRRDTLNSRSNSLAKIASGEMVNKTLHWVDPVRCKMWEHHNRRYELLSPSRCEDLLVGIQAQGRQEFPAVVRKLKGNPDFDYEVICGARRHWAITYLRSQHYDFKFLIEIRDLNDEEAFRLSDIENRDREDISDYERAEDYQNALDLYYNSLSQMAERLEVRVDWLSRYLDLALLPKEVVALYPDVTQIRTRHARGLKPYLKNKKGTTQLIEASTVVAKIQNEREEAGQTVLDGTQVFQSLVSTLQGPKKASRSQSKIYNSAVSNKPMLEVNAPGKTNIAIKLLLKSGASKEELLTVFKEIVDNHF